VRGEGRERGEVLGAQRPAQLGLALAEPFLESHGARVPTALDLEVRREPARRLLERAVLQQAGEEQVAGLEECDVLGVDELALRQEAGDLQVEERRRDHEELRGAVELLRGVEAAQVGDELDRSRPRATPR
jgi:hypothetical protein